MTGREGRAAAPAAEARAGLPLVIAVAPNGARRAREDHPALPLTAAELAREAARSAAAGAALLHLHARDREGRHTLDPGACREALEAVRRRLGRRMLLQLSTEAAGRYRPEEQRALVRQLRPEAVSLALAELLPAGGDEGEAAAFYAWVARRGILPQHILYSAAEAERFGRLVERGVIPASPGSVLLVLGRYGGPDAAPADLDPLLAALPPGLPWMACAFGPAEHACMLAAARRGGHCRVGFENNLELPGGGTAPDNAALVAALAAAARELGRPLADADAARQLMGGGMGG